MTKYQSTYRCSDCRHEFQRTTNYLPKKEPACPKCKKTKRMRTKSVVTDKTHNLDADSRMQDMIDSRQGPSFGPSNKTKAIDITNEVVSANYQTNFALDERMRDGSTVDKLTPRQAELKGAMFNGKGSKTMPVLDVMEGKVKHVPRRGIDARTKKIISQINSGALKEPNDVVSTMHRNKTAMNVNVVADDRPRQ